MMQQKGVKRCECVCVCVCVWKQVLTKFFEQCGAGISRQIGDVDEMSLGNSFPSNPSTLL